ncbi:unnamed protein product [Medioppia subpectinata]|uniref:Guanylate cyclase domain-containing protein n=1 Tax=Medioppia subpectinata TaxID=1979941 RepID=A0A7R9LK16_9ACAR|nr:unnamed protein product [Medioppia subpectinata]CAG2119499.1 unnamed protein product [Medioppia subpectinata]
MVKYVVIVNVASRMDTNGLIDRIHTTEEVGKILIELNFPYKPVCRGAMNIKGKGMMSTYLIDSNQKVMIEEYLGFF